MRRSSLKSAEALLEHSPDADTTSLGGVHTPASTVIPDVSGSPTVDDWESIDMWFKVADGDRQATVTTKNTIFCFPSNHRWPDYLVLYKGRAIEAYSIYSGAKAINDSGILRGQFVLYELWNKDSWTINITTDLSNSNPVTKPPKDSFDGWKSRSKKDKRLLPAHVYRIDVTTGEIRRGRHIVRERSDGDSEGFTIVDPDAPKDAEYGFTASKRKKNNDCCDPDWYFYIEWEDNNQGLGKLVPRTARTSSLTVTLSAHALTFGNHAESTGLVQGTQLPKQTQDPHSNRTYRDAESTRDVPPSVMRNPSSVPSVSSAHSSSSTAFVGNLGYYPSDNSSRRYARRHSETFDASVSRSGPQYAHATRSPSASSSATGWTSESIPNGNFQTYENAFIPGWTDVSSYQESTTMSTVTPGPQTVQAAHEQIRRGQVQHTPAVYIAQRSPAPRSPPYPQQVFAYPSQALLQPKKIPASTPMYSPQSVASSAKHPPQSSTSTFQPSQYTRLPPATQQLYQHSGSISGSRAPSVRSHSTPQARMSGDPRRSADNDSTINNRNGLW